MLGDYAHSEDILKLQVVFISCFFGEGGCREGGLNKEPRYIRISFQGVDSNQNSQLIAVRRPCSEFTTSGGRYSPLTGTSLTSTLKNAEHTHRGFKKHTSCMKFYPLAKFSLELIDITMCRSHHKG